MTTVLFGVVPDVVAESFMDALSMSACVTVYVALQVVSAPGASVVVAQVGPVEVGQPEHSGCRSRLRWPG